MSRKFQVSPTLPGGSTEPGATGVPTLRAKTSTNITTGATSGTIPIPSGTQAGDLMIAFVTLDQDVSAMSTPTGWTAFSWSPITIAAVMETYCWYKVAASGESSASITWTTSAKGAITTTTYYNVDATTPIHNSNKATSTSAAASATTPSITPTIAGTVAVGLFVQRTTTSGNKSITWTADAVLPNKQVDGNNGAAASSPWLGYAVGDSGVTVANGVAVQSVYASNFSESNHLSALILLRPATAGGTPQAGDLWYRSDKSLVESYSGSAWVPSSIPWVCTSLTRPASPPLGTTIFETDSNCQLIWTGSAWRLLKGRLLRVRLAGAQQPQAIPDTTSTPLHFDTIDSDPYLGWSTSTWTYTFPVAVSGTAVASAALISVTSPGTRYLFLYKNGAAYGATMTPGVANVAQPLTTSVEDDFAVGDTLQARMIQFTGGSAVNTDTSFGQARLTIYA